MSMTVRMRGNISKTSTGKYSGDVTVEFTEDMDKQLSGIGTYPAISSYPNPPDAAIDKTSAYAATDLMVSNLRFRLSEMADWMDKELKARGGE